MRHPRVLWLFGALAATTAFVACASVEGLNDLSFDQSTGGNASTSTTKASVTATTTTTTTTSSTMMTVTTTTTTTTTTSAVTTSTGTGTEDCTNGVDDNGDGKIDCADPACAGAGFSCVDLPSGFDGPMAVVVSGDTSGIDCPAGYDKQAYTGGANLTPEDAICDACVCTPGFTCTPADVVAFNSATCTSSGGLDGGASDGGSLNVPQSDNCMAWPPEAPTAGAHANKGTLDTSAGCAPSGGDATVPPPNWGTEIIACKPTQLGGGCSGNTSCFPPLPSSPFSTKYCISKSGDVSCPGGSGNFSVKLLFHDGVNDTRDCSACGCGNGTGTCDVLSRIYDDTICADQVAAFDDDGTCNAATGAKSIYADITIDGSCPTFGGDPTGSISASNAETTFCCQP